MKKVRWAITAAVEGDVDGAVVKRLIVQCRGEVGDVHGRNGKDDLRRRVGGYNNAARFSPWIVLIDLDDEAECAPPLRSSWIPSPVRGMCLRIAVRAVEAWLLADRAAASRFFSVGLGSVPGRPEEIEDPKRAMVDLAGRSRRREIREDMVPRPGSGRSVGPAYSSRLIEYASSVWRPGVAARSSDSLRRCLIRLNEAIGG